MNRRTLVVVALSALATVAGVVHDRRAPAADAKRTLLLLLGLVALAIYVASQREGSSERPARAIGHPAWTCALAFVGCSALSALWGLPSGLLDLGMWTGAAALAIAVRGRGLRATVVLMRSVALGLGGASSLLVLTSYARGLRGLSLHGGQGNPNWLGLLLAVTLPLSIEATCALRRRPRRAPFALAALASTVQLPALLLAHSRVAWLAAAVALVVLGTSRASSESRARWARGARRGVVALVTVGALAALPPSSKAQASPADSSTGEATPLDSLRGRVFLARVSAHAAVHALPFGVGLGGFGHAYLEAQGEVLSVVAPREASHRFLNATTAHDEWLQVAIESGPIALGLLVVSLGLAILALHRARQHGASAALVACAICATGDSPLRQPAIVLMVALVLASIPGNVRVDTLAPRRSRRLLLEGALLLGCALLLATSLRSWLSARLRTAANEAAPAERLSLLARSARVDRGSGESALELGLARLDGGDPDGALVDLMRSRRLLANVGTSIAIGNAELALDHPELAEVSYREALSFHPGSMRAHTNLADALRRLGRFDEAEQHAAVALQLSPGDARIQALIDRIHLERMDSSTQ